MDKPNLFQIATSELSQDAFVAWLLKWADKKYLSVDENLHLCAVSFIRSLIDDVCDITNVEVKRQWKNIDITVKIDDKYFIVIEDKKGTKEHSNQLKRYAEIAKKEYPDRKIILVYFKMEEQSNYSAIKAADYSIYTRKNMLFVLELYYKKETKKNDIILDYYNYLKWLDDKINSFKKLSFEKWHWYSWIGFFSTLQNEIKDGNWGYVSNPAGGFQGFWWHWKTKVLDEKAFKFYLQLEQEKLIFKLSSDKSEHRKEIRRYYRDILYKTAKNEKINISQYGRLGKWMGVAKLNEEDYRIKNKDGLIDMKATIENLKRMEKLIDLVAIEMDKE